MIIVQKHKEMSHMGENGEVTLYEKFKIDKPIQKESDDQER